MLSKMRSVVMESGTWRWARRASPRQEIGGNGRHLAWAEVFFYFCLTAAHFQTLCHQKAISRDAQRGVVVKAAPAPTLVVTQAVVLFQVLNMLAPRMTSASTAPNVPMA